MHRILFQAGPFTLYTYGFFVALGFLLAMVLIGRDSKKIGLEKNKVFDCLIAVLIGGLAGGRLLFVILNWHLFRNDIARIVMINEGGMAVQGAMLMGVLSGAVAARVKRIPFWKTADLFAPYMALGQSVGRVGCFMNGCCYGKAVSSGVRVTFPGDEVSRIPVQLYSSFSLLAICIILLLLRKKRYFDGHAFALYLLLYSVYRFFMDFMRADNPPVFGSMSLSQIISIGTFFTGIALYMILRRYSLLNRDGEYTQLKTRD
ncbi:MAG: prolipoprotein diacylglyceryl transferase [Candidatus Omnitrophota bacterium]